MSYYDTALNSTENIALSNFLQPILAENTFFLFSFKWQEQSSPQVLYKKAVLKNFAIFMAKHVR